MHKEKIIEMLNCHNSNNIQQKGINLALKQKDLDFVMHYSSHPAYAKNCAKIITSLKYDKSKKYIYDLFVWMESFNNVGAQEIYEYLKKAPTEVIYNEYVSAKASAQKRNDVDALYILNLFERERQGIENL